MIRLIQGDALERLRELPAESVQCCITSPPYFRLRDYEHQLQIGREISIEAYLDRITAVFAEVRRVLAADASLWLNIGDSYAAGGNGGGGRGVAKRRQWAGADTRKGWRSPPPGYKQRDLLGIPWLLAMRLRSYGWHLRRDIIWSKVVATEPPRRDRPATGHEYVFLLSKSQRSSVRDPGEPWFNNSVWSHRPNGSDVEHQALMEPEIARRCILAGSRPGNTILDPFSGAGTTALVADRLQRDAIGIELNPDYIEIAKRRIAGDAGMFAQVA